MKRNVTIFILITVVVLGFAVHSVWTLLGLLVATGREDAILRGELPAPNSGTINQRPQLIPKIIHQTYKNESIPDYEYKLWTDKKSREFIAAEYVCPHSHISARANNSQISLVPRDIRRLPLPYPTRRCDSILCASPLWRNLY
jgi:hypothetical protein